MKTEVKQLAYSVRFQMTITLLFLFLFFVIMDAATTQWLAINSPGGIANEINPIGVLLYTNFGSAGLIFPKFGVFSVFAVLSVYLGSRYSYIRWFTEFVQSIILIQLALSLITSFNNFVAILASFYVKGNWPLVGITSQTAVATIFLADVGLGTTLSNGIMYVWGIKSRSTHVKVFMSLLVFVFPVLLFSEAFTVHISVFAMYIAAASSILGLFFYLTERERLSIAGRRS